MFIGNGELNVFFLSLSVCMGKCVGIMHASHHITKVFFLPRIFVCCFYWMVVWLLSKTFLPLFSFLILNVFPFVFYHPTTNV